MSVMPVIDPWVELNDAVLTVFADDVLGVGDVQRKLPDVPGSYVRAALHLNADLDYLHASRDASRTTYTITEAGKRHLADTKAMA
jgi:hypothetical protein